MTATTCIRGHRSATADYCDVCGVPMSRGSAGSAPDSAGGAAPAPGSGVPEQVPGAGGSAGGGSEPAGESTPATPCPVCGTPRAGRFCEEDGYDFLLAPPVSPAPAGAAAGAGGVDPAGTAGDPSDPGRPGGVPVGSAPPDGGSVEAGRPAAGDTWQLMVDADREYFGLVTSLGGADAGSLTFPRFVVPRWFTLERRQLLIGRRSRSRGVRPDIDLVGPPEDPGVSHLHALLLPQPEGWAVVDLESANGTYLNDPSTAPIVANTPIPLGDGDRVYLGAWTRLTIRAAG